MYRLRSYDRTSAKSLAIVGLTASVLTSCYSGGGSDSCDDIDFTAYENEVTVTGINDITVLQRLDNGSLAATDENNAIALSELEIHVTMEYVRQLRDDTQARFNPLDWFFGAAHACTLAPYEGDIESQATKAELLSNADLGDFAAGSSLNTVFQIAEERLQGINYGHVSADPSRFMNDFAAEASVTAAVKYVLFSEHVLPSAQLMPELHQFTFSLSLDTGEMFTRMSDAVLVSM